MYAYDVEVVSYIIDTFVNSEAKITFFSYSAGSYILALIVNQLATAYQALVDSCVMVNGFYGVTYLDDNDYLTKLGTNLYLVGLFNRGKKLKNKLLYSPNILKPVPSSVSVLLCTCTDDFLLNSTLKYSTVNPNTTVYTFTGDHFTFVQASADSYMIQTLSTYLKNLKKNS